MFIRRPPSPVTATTRRPGSASLAAIAPGSPMPMAANPLEIMTVFGSCARNRCATQSLGAPPSEITRSSGSRTDSRDDALGEEREPVVEATRVVGRAAWRAPLRADRHHRRQELKGLTDVGHDLDRGLVARID